MPGQMPGMMPAPMPYGGSPYGGVQQTTTTVSTFPQSYQRVTYNYPQVYSRHHAFSAPYGVPPHVQGLFMEASNIFRQADRDFSGFLNKKEWKRAMRMLGITFNKYDAKRLFFMVDTDRSGRISEREFCEYWVYQKNYMGSSMPSPMY